MEIDEIFGLPAHPLLVHAAVVLLPLAALGLVLVALRPGWRRHYAPVVFGFAVAALASIALAQGSGEQLEDRVEETRLVEAHADEGESVMPWAIGVAVLSGAVLVAEPLARRSPALRTKGVGIALTVLSIAAAAGATYTVVAVGHSGAKAAWDDLPAVGQSIDADG